MELTRRRYLTHITSTGCLVGVAGCSGSGGGSSKPSPPDENANPKELLPKPKQDWKRTNVAQEGAHQVGGEAGFNAIYKAPSGTEYQAATYRWPSKSDATGAKDTFSGFGASVYVVLGNFSFIGYGPDVEKLNTLLGYSPALTQEYVSGNNMLE